MTTSAGKKKAAAASAEAGGEPVTINAHGLELTLPARLPFALMWEIGDGDNLSPQQVVGFLRALLGDEQAQKVRDAGLSMDDGLDLLEQILAATGMTPGESPASPKS